MTKVNRENLYKHMRFLENNYEALQHLNSGMTATSMVRKRAKESADAILLKHPELETPIKVEEVKPMEKKNAKK